MSKIIIENSNNRVKYAFDDLKSLTVSSESIIVGDPVDYIVGDLNSNTATVVLNVTLPEDFQGNKYEYDNGIWTIWSGWEDYILRQEAKKKAKEKLLLH